MAEVALQKVNELLELRLKPDALDALEALLLRWSICEDQDVADLSKRIVRLDPGVRVSCRDALLSLARVKMPFRQPTLKSIPFTKGPGQVDALPEAVRVFFYRGYKVHDLIAFGEGTEPVSPAERKGHGTYKEKEVERPLVHNRAHVSESAFRVVVDETQRTLLNAKTVEYEDVISPFDEPLGPLEPLDVDWEDVAEAQRAAGKKPGQVAPHIEWLRPEKTPEPGSKMELILEYDPADRPHSIPYDDSAKNTPAIPAGLYGTATLSPLGKTLLSSDEVARRASDWDTVVKFSVADRVTEFIPISSKTRLVDFQKALSKKAHTDRNDGLPRRVSAKEIKSKYSRKRWWYVPYTLAVSGLDYKDKTTTSKLWALVDLELVHRLGFSPRAVPEKTRIQLEAIAQVEKQKSKPGWTKSKIERATNNVADALKRLAGPAPVTGRPAKALKPDLDRNAPDPNDPDAEREAFVDKQVSVGYSRHARAKKRAAKIKKSLGP